MSVYLHPNRGKNPCNSGAPRLAGTSPLPPRVGVCLLPIWIGHPACVAMFSCGCGSSGLSRCVPKKRKKILAASLAPASAPFPIAAAARTTGLAPSLATPPTLPYPSAATAPAEPRSSSSPDPRIVFCMSQLWHCLPRCTSRVSLPASIVPLWLLIALALSQIRCTSALIALLLLSCYLISFSSSTAYLLTAASSLHLPWRQHQLMRRQSQLAAVYLDAPVGLAGGYVQDLGST
jgi:hypothetical protein